MNLSTIRPHDLADEVAQAGRLGSGPISLQITPGTPTIAVGTSVPFVAVELWSDGTTYGLTAPVDWSSSGKSVVISNFNRGCFRRQHGDGDDNGTRD